MNENQKSILKHSLGLNYGKKSFRNHYAIDIKFNGPDQIDIKNLVNLGFMKRGRDISGNVTYFHVTKEGEEALAQEGAA